jgi:uncharacterized protein YwgA
MEGINEKTSQLNEISKFILLLLRASDTKPIPGALWLQKEMFLLQNVFSKLAEEADFEPYLMGPYSEIVANEAQELQRSKLVKLDGQKISLTGEGKLISEAIMRKSDKKEIQKIEEFKELINDLSKEELLAFIYFSYPLPQEIAQESIEYKDLLPKRKKLAISLYQKDKVSAQKDAQIAGENLEDFIEDLKKVV